VDGHGCFNEAQSSKLKAQEKHKTRTSKRLGRDRIDILDFELPLIFEL
jgi:hypothetical protein